MVAESCEVITAITGGKVTHDGKNIGATHIHGGVVPGGGLTDVPAN